MVGFMIIIKIQIFIMEMKDTRSGFGAGLTELGKTNDVIKIIGDMANVISIK